MLSGAESDDISPSNPELESFGRSSPRRAGLDKIEQELLIGASIVAVFALTSIAVFVAGVLHIQITPYNPLKQDVGHHSLRLRSLTSWERINWGVTCSVG